MEGENEPLLSNKRSTKEPDDLSNTSTTTDMSNSHDVTVRSEVDYPYMCYTSRFV